MSDRWGSVQQIKDELGLASSVTDFEGLRRDLYPLIRAVHPDSLGRPPTPAEDERARDLTAALEVLKEAEANAKSLVPISTATELAVQFAKAIQTIAPPVHPGPSVEERISARVAAQRAAIGRGLILPRIPLAALTAAMTLIIAFPGQLNRYLLDDMRPLLTSPGYPVVAGAIALVWIGTWVWEAMGKATVSFLNTSDTQRMAVRLAQQFRDPEPSPPPEYLVGSQRGLLAFIMGRPRSREWGRGPYAALYSDSPFSRGDLQRALGLLARRHLPIMVRMFPRLPVGDDVLESAADATIERFTARNFIEETEGPDAFDQWFKPRRRSAPLP